MDLYQLSISYNSVTVPVCIQPGFEAFKLVRSQVKRYTEDVSKNFQVPELCNTIKDIKSLNMPLDVYSYESSPAAGSIQINY